MKKLKSAFKIRNALKEIIDDIHTNTQDTFSLQLIKYLLLEPEITDKFLKIYIHLLFITYLFKEPNFSFRSV